jgi:hypothetical protein
MKLIKPSEISAWILTLLDESDERVIIVSPFMKISKWYKIVKKINELKTRGIISEINVRDDLVVQETVNSSLSPYETGLYWSACSGMDITRWNRSWRIKS